MSVKPKDIYNVVQHFRQADCTTEEGHIGNLMSSVDLCLKERLLIPADLVQELADRLWSRTNMSQYPMRDARVTQEYVDRPINESIDCSCAEGNQMLHVEITVRREGKDVVREAKVNGQVRWSERVWINAWVKADRPHQFMDEVEQFFNPKDRF